MPRHALTIHVLDEYRRHVEIAVLREWEGVNIAHHLEVAPGGGNHRRRPAAFQQADHLGVLLHCVKRVVLGGELGLGQLAAQQDDLAVKVELAQGVQGICHDQGCLHIAAQAVRVGLSRVVLPAEAQVGLAVGPIDAGKPRGARPPAQGFQFPGEIVRRLAVVGAAYRPVGQVGAQALQMGLGAGG